MEALNRVKPFPLVRRPGLRNLPIIQINGVPIEDEDNTDIEAKKCCVLFALSLLPLIIILSVILFRLLNGLLEN